MRLDLLQLDRGTPLDSVLAEYGVEFPCGGAGICQGCRVRVLEGSIPITEEMREAFTPDELAAGWRLGCRGRAEGPVVLEVSSWTTPVLGDDSPVAHEPAEGVGIAIDLGTTTLVAQAMDLMTADVLAVKTALNPQTVHGADVMSRIELAQAGGAAKLAGMIRKTLGEMIRHLPGKNRTTQVMLAGNTAMHHLFCGIDVAPLASVPFQPVNDGEQIFTPAELNWDLPAGTVVRFLPCLGGFVGSDILAGIMATRIGESERPRALIDLGTNGEIVVGNAQRILCASTAAGPAFEGGRIRMGMRAAVGAIAHVALDHGRPVCRTIGAVPPRGICGSGLVDAIAVGLEMEAIQPNGRLAGGEFRLEPPVTITQRDVRELQFAKGAIAAGLRILLQHWGAAAHDLEAVYLAGAFGNYVNVESARRIGLLEIRPDRIVPAGNTALRGVKMTMLCPSRPIGIRAEHVPLASDPEFQNTFLECLAFSPESRCAT